MCVWRFPCSKLKVLPVTYKSCMCANIHAQYVCLCFKHTVQFVCVCFGIYVILICECSVHSKHVHSCPECMLSEINKHNPPLFHSDRSRSPPCPAYCFHHPGSRSANPISGKASASSSHKPDASLLSNGLLAPRALHVVPFWFHICCTMYSSSMFHSLHLFICDIPPTVCEAVWSWKCLLSVFLLCLFSLSKLWMFPRWLGKCLPTAQLVRK